MPANIKFLSDFIFLLIFKDFMTGLIFIDSQTGRYFLRFQITICETLKKRKSDKKQVFADIVCFDLSYHSEKKREIQTGENYVHQALSKVFVFYTYSSHQEIIFVQKIYIVSIDQKP